MNVLMNKFTKREKRIITNTIRPLNTVVVKVHNGRWIVTSTKYPTPTTRRICISK